MIKQLILASVLMTSGTLWATDLYVSPSGSGTTCSQAAPCSVATGQSSFPAGGSGTLHFANGTYPSHLDITKSGAGPATGSRIAFKCDSGAASAIAAIGKCIFPQGISVALNVAGGNNVDIVGFDIGGTASLGVGINIISDSSLNAANSVHVIGNYVHDLGASVSNSANVVGCPQNGAIQGNNNGNFQITGLQIIGNYIKNFGGGFPVAGCNTAQGIYVTSPALIYNNLVVNVPVGGIQVSIPCNTNVSNNTLISMADNIILASDWVSKCPSGIRGNMTLANNALYNSNNKFFNVGGASMCSSSAHNLYENNISDGLNVIFNPARNSTCESVTNATPSTQPGASFFVNYVTSGATFGDYHLKALSAGILGGLSACNSTGGISPCIPPSDFAGAARPLGGAQDVGVFVSSAAGVPIVNFTPSPLAFGTVPVSTASQLLLTLKNAATSGPALTFSTPTITGTNAADFVITSTTCGTSLAAGASCTYTITFTPHGSGARSATLTLTDNAAGSPHQVPFTGTGGSAAMTLLPTSLAFGTIAPGSCSTAQTTLITSTGSTSVTITDKVFIGANPTQFAFGGTGTCGGVPLTLASGTSCLQSVKFCPTTTGALSASLSFPNDSPVTPVNLALTGAGGTSTATFLPATFAYGNQQVGTSSAAHAFIYTNTGTLALNITGVSEDSTSYSSTDNCPRAPSTLAVAATCTVNVVFKPINTGALPAIVSVIGDASQTAAVSGTGTQANITITPVTFNFGNVLVGQVSSDQTFIINNTGTASANIGSVTAAAPFSVASTTCGATLASNTTCNAVARFTPTVVGLVAGQLVVADNAPGNPHTAALSGTGTAAAVTILPATLAFGNQAVGTVSTPKATIMTNTGSGSLTGPGIVINNLDQVTTLWPPTGWKPVCILPTCQPGGVGVPTATSQTFNNATPSIDGASMKVSVTGPAFTNALWVYAAGADESVLNMTSDFWTQPSANSAVLGSFEFDQAIFNKTLGINFMFGTQCNQASNKWQVWNQLTTSWVNVVGSTCTSLTPGSFHHIIQRVHRVEGDLTGCTGEPCLYYDSITVDGVAVPGLPMTEPAGPLDPTFQSGVVWHVQLDIGSTGSAGQPVFENIDKLIFSFNSVNFTGANPTDFSQTNTCPQSIAAGGSCPINVIFTPGGTGARSATMSVATNAASSPTLVALTGTGTSTAPAVCLDRSSINFGNQPVGTTSGNQPIQITNCGTDNLIVLAPTPSANFTASTSCGTIAPLATCNVNIAFAPSAAGTLTGTVNINSNAISSPNVVTVQGFGTQTGATLTPTSVNFGTITLGQSSAPTTLLLTNTSNIAIAPLAPVRTGANPSDFTSGACPTSLAANATCTYGVTFTPLAAGARTSTLTQTFNNISTVLTVALSGTGQSTAPAVTLIPTSINFGSVTQGVSTSSQNIQLTNSGTNTLHVTSVTPTGTNSGDVTLSADHCSGVAVTVGGVCTVTVAMTPGGLGARTANAHFITDATPSTNDVTLAVIGLAAAAPQATFSANTLAFGNIKTGQTSAAQTITVGNIGNGNLIVSSVTLTGANPTQYTQSNNCATVIPNLSCTVTVNFTPTAQGSKPASLTIASNDPTTPSKVVTLTGTGKGHPKAVIGATAISFGATTVGTTSGPAAFTITNTGDDTLNVSSVTTAGDSFPSTNSCVCCPVAPGDSCAVTVQFNPQLLCGQTDINDPTVCTSNTHLGVATIVTDADTTTQTVSLEGLAIPVPIPPGPIIISVGGAAQVGGVLRIGYDAAAPVACNGYGNNGYGGSGGCGYGQ